MDGFKLKPERDIVLYGKSLGSCPTCYLASKTRVRGIIIVSGLASGARVLFPTTKLALMDMLYFNNVGRLGGSKSPTQIVHGTHDEVIPFSNGSDLHYTCQKFHPLPPAWIDGATHNNLETVHSTAYMRAFRSFLQHILAHPPPETAPPREGWLGFMDKILPQSHKEKTTMKRGNSNQALAEQKAVIPGVEALPPSITATAAEAAAPGAAAAALAAAQRAAS